MNSKIYVLVVAQLLLLVCTNSIAQSDLYSKKNEPDSMCSNYYFFGDSVNAALLTAISKVQILNQDKSIKKEDFYILLDKDEKFYYLMLDFCKDCAFLPIIKSSHYFIKISEDLTIPVISQFDVQFNKQAVRKRITIGGYFIKINNKGKIIDEGNLQ